MTNQKTYSICEVKSFASTLLEMARCEVDGFTDFHTTSLIPDPIVPNWHHAFHRVCCGVLAFWINTATLTFDVFIQDPNGDETDGAENENCLHIFSETYNSQNEKTFGYLVDDKDIIDILEYFFDNILKQYRKKKIEEFKKLIISEKSKKVFETISLNLENYF